ncbi:MAG TPA: Mur ligase family protein [Capsulimonadaceae bacterium]
MDYREAAEYMGSLLRLGIKLGNSRFEALLERLGSPHRQLRSVHVGGTKGKGSTATFATAILRAAGYSVGTYLSPFVYDLRERVQVDGEMISEADFARIVTLIRPHIEALAETEHGATTEFELKTAVGFVYFAEQNVDYAVIEVGLGGRLDATNVLPESVVSIITNIGLDHVEMLGNTLSAIAGEKAGIIKPGGLCVTGIADDTPYGVVRRTAQKQGARIVRVREPQDWCTERDHTLSIAVEGLRLEHVGLKLRGRFQHANAALAAIALHTAGIALTSDQIQHGIETATLPGRFEVIRSSSPTVVVDVAHNELAGRVLRDALVEELHGDQRPVVMVVGVSRNHDPAEILLPLVRADGKRGLNIAALIATEPQFRPRRVEDIVVAARTLGINAVSIEGSVKAAALRALMTASKHINPVVVVTGSFYTVGELDHETWEELFDLAGYGATL